MNTDQKFRSNVILNGSTYEVCTDASVSRLVDHVHAIARDHGYSTIWLADENGVSPVGVTQYAIVDTYSTATVGLATIKVA